MLSVSLVIQARCRYQYSLVQMFAVFVIKALQRKIVIFDLTHTSIVAPSLKERNDEDILMMNL